MPEEGKDMCLLGLLSVTSMCVCSKYLMSDISCSCHSQSPNFVSLLLFMLHLSAVFMDFMLHLSAVCMDE